MKRNLDVIVLGGGLAGLSAAYRLGSRCIVLEKEDAPGGLCRTSEEAGYRFDRTGHLLHLRSESLRKTVLSLLDEEPLRIERRARVFSNGVYTHYPFQAHTFGLPKPVVAECLAGFVEAKLAERDIDKAPSTFEEFILRHFGEGIAKRFMIPYNTKLWGVHPREITADWCARFVPVPTVEEVMGGAIGLHRDDMGYNARFLYPALGIEELAQALARRVPKIMFKTQPKKIDHRNKRILVGGEWLPYRALITTIPLTDLLSLLADPPERIRSAKKRLRYTSLLYLDIALSRRSGTDYHWSYVPEKKYPFYRVGCYSNFSERMAPRGKSNLYVELSSRRRAPLEALMPKVAEGLKEMGIIKGESDIAFVRERRLRHAYVVYDHNYSKAAPATTAWLSERGILSAGRYANWEYSSMEDAISQGFHAAALAKELLG